VASVGRKAEVTVRVDRVEPQVLELVRAQLVQDADPSALVSDRVEHDPSPFRGHASQSEAQLGAAVASQRPQDVSGEALRMQTDQESVSRADLPTDDGEVDPSGSCLDATALKLPVRGRDRGAG